MECNNFIVDNILQIFLILFGYIFILPSILLIVSVNEVIRLFINLILNFNTPYHLIGGGTGGRKTASYVSEKEGKVAALCFLSSEIEDVDMEKEIRWISQRLFEGNNGKGPFDLLKSTFTTRFGYTASKRMDNFDIRNHISIWQETQSLNDVVEEKELYQTIFPSLMEPFDCDLKPPWKLVIIPKVLFHGELQTIRILRIHFTYGDGYSLFSLLSSLMDFKGSRKGKDKGTSFFFNPWKSLSLRERFQIKWIWIKAFLSVPYMMAKNLFFPDKHLLGNTDPFVLTAKRQPLYSYRYCISPEFELSALKDCAKSAGLDVTSTIVTAYRNALGRVCLETGLAQDESRRLSYCTSFILPCVRKWGFENQSFEIEHETPLHSKEPARVINAEERLEKIWWRILENWVDRMPAFVFRWIIRSQFYEGIKVSTYLANAPFTREKGFWLGKRVNALGFFEADSTPLCITGVACSYGDGIRIYSAVNSSLEISSHMDLIFKYFQEEIKHKFGKAES